MKRKLFLAIIAVLVVCLMCGVLFVACNDDPPSPGTDDPIGPVDPDNPDPGDEDDELTKSDVFIDLVNDFDAIEQDTTGEKEFTFGLQIKDRADQTSVFSIALENVGGKDYLYGAVGTTVFTKFNGFDLGETFMTILNWLGPIDLSQVVGIQAGLDVESLTNPLVAGIVSDMLIGDFAVSESGDAYMVELNIAKLVSSLAGFGLDLDAVINGALGEDTVTTVVNALAGVIGIELAEGSATVTGLLNAIANAYQVNFYFGFDTATADAADPFDGLLPGVQAARDTQAKNLLNFTVDATMLGYDKVTTPGEGEGAEDVVTVAEEPNKKYKISLGVDMNIFELLPLLDYVSTTGGVMTGDLQFAFNVDDPAEIVAMAEKLGYFNLTVDEVNIEDGSLVKNLITIHSNFEEGIAIVALNLPNINYMLDINLQLGGVYDFNGLADVIAGLIDNASGAASEAGTDDATETSDGIMDIITSVLACIDMDNIATDGVTIDAEQLVNDVLADLVTDAAMREAVLNFIGSDVLNIKAVAGFQTCTDESKVVTTDLISWIGTYIDEEGTAVTKEQGEYIVEVTGMDERAAFPEDGNAEDGIVRYPEGQMFGFAQFNNYDRRIPLIGKTLSGEEITFYGYIVGTNMPGGLYPEAGTYENPVFYIGLSNGFDTTIGALQLAGLLTIEQGWPVSGIIPFQYEGTIEIVALSEGATTTNSLDGTSSAPKTETTVGSTAFSGMIGSNSQVITVTVTDDANDLTWSKTMKNTGWAVFDAEGNDVSDTAIEYKKGAIALLDKYLWTEAGTFKLVIYVGTLSLEYQVTVTEA